jgi:hypothetical protein
MMAETTTISPALRPYHRPEPRLFGLTFWSLLIPATIWVVGVIIYGAEALKAQDLSWKYQGIGSTLMVIGGELGTITTAWQIFRKKKSGMENFWDWVCLGISLIATEGTLFVIFTRQTDITATWVTISQTYGPLALLLFSGLDVYANVHELGMYNRDFDDAWEKWNEGRYQDELRQLRKLTPVAQIDPVPSLTPDILTAILAQIGPAPDGHLPPEIASVFNNLSLLPVGVQSPAQANEQEDSQVTPHSDIDSYFPPADGTTPDTYLKSLPPGKRRDLLLDICREQPDITQGQLAEHFGVSRTTIVNDMKALTVSGYLRRNGHGIEVLVNDNS